MEVLLAELPDWADSEFLKTASTVSVFIAAALLIIILVWVRSLAMKLLLVVLVGAGAVGLFFYRDDLENCAKTCDCSFLGDNVPTDGCDGFINPTS